MTHTVVRGVDEMAIESTGGGSGKARGTDADPSYVVEWRDGDRSPLCPATATTILLPESIDGIGNATRRAEP